MLLVVFFSVGMGLIALLSVLVTYFRRAPDLRARRMAVALRSAITMPHDDRGET
jgi:hypothetical protein